MKKLFGVCLLLLLVACSPTTQPNEAAESGAEGTSQTAESPLAAASEEEESGETAVSAHEPVAPITPATTLVEASQVRPQDQVIGAVNPKVVIIEYGDFQ